MAPRMKQGGAKKLKKKLARKRVAKASAEVKASLVRNRISNKRTSSKIKKNRLDKKQLDLERKLFMQRFRKFWRRKHTRVYTAIFLIILSIILCIGVAESGWVSQDEMDAAVRANNLSLGGLFSAELINFPFVLLQKISFWLFGVTVFSIKLPSLILGVICLWLVNSVTKRWFSSIIANFTSLIFASTIGFLLAASSGTANILHVFYPLLITFLINQIAIHPGRAQRYVLALFVASIVAFYTPYMAYMVVLTVAALYLHPKTRFYLKTNEKRVYLIGGIIAGLILAPMVISIFFDIGLVKGLFLPIWSSEIWSNFLNTLVDHVFMFRAGVVGASLAPMFNLAVFGLLVLGVGQLIRNRYTFRSHLLTFLIMCGIIQVWGNNSLTVALVVPLILTASWGLHYLLVRWQTLFPINPYANAIGFVLAALIAMAIFVTDWDFFTMSTRFSADWNQSVSLSLQTLESADLPDNSILVIDSNAPNVQFWQLIAEKRHLNVDQPTYQVFLTDGKTPAVSGWKIHDIIPSTDRRTVIFVLAKPAQ